LAFFLLCIAGLLVGVALVVTTGVLASPPRYGELAIVGGGVGVAVTGAIVLKLKFKMNGLLAALLCIVSIGTLLIGICGSL
jgi:hypothetical protein